jgi:hypothetical protein
MGYNTIEQKKAEFARQRQAMEVIAKAIQDITAAAGKILEQEQELARKKAAFNKWWQDAHVKVRGLACDDDPVLKNIKWQMVEAWDEMNDPERRNLQKKLPSFLKALEAWNAQKEREIHRMVLDWVDKNVMNCPAVLNVGMVFKSYVRKGLFVITQGPKSSTNPNLRGDAAILYEMVGKGVSTDGQKADVSLAELKDGSKWKFVKT